MDVTITVPDRLVPVLRAAVTASGDKSIQAFVASALRDALEVPAQQAVQVQQQVAYRAALDAAQQQVRDDLDAIGAK